MSVKPHRTATHFGIPYSWNDADADTQRFINEIRTTESPVHRRWENYVARYTNRDFLGDLLACKVKESGQDLELHTTTRRILEARLQARLLKFAYNGISPNGGILYYTDRLDKCQVYEYSIPYALRAAASVKHLVDIPEPDFLYDIGTAIRDADDDTTSALKNALVYGHKIVSHRNTIVHVDRRRDEGTAGPFIDTLILNEMMHKYFYEHAATLAPDNAHLFTKAAEVGCGNGLLIASCAQNLPRLSTVTAIDPVMTAVHCAYRNFIANISDSPQVPTSHFICSLFDKSLLSNYDAVFCNPPYIPHNPSDNKKLRNSSAIAGTGLLSEIILSANDILSPQGFIFMVFSDLASKEFDAAIAQADVEYVTLGPSDGFRVRFDQDEVFKNVEWVEYLIDERDLELREKKYWHILRCVAIHRKHTNNFQDSLGLLHHINTMNGKLRKERK